MMGGGLRRRIQSECSEELVEKLKPFGTTGDLRLVTGFYYGEGNS